MYGRAQRVGVESREEPLIGRPLETPTKVNNCVIAKCTLNTDQCKIIVTFFFFLLVDIVFCDYLFFLYFICIIVLCVCIKALMFKTYTSIVAIK